MWVYEKTFKIIIMINWFKNTAIFKGFTLVLLIFILISIIGLVIILLICLHKEDFSFFQKAFQDIYLKRFKISLLYMVASLFFSYLIAIEN